MSNTSLLKDEHSVNYDLNTSQVTSILDKTHITSDYREPDSDNHQY